MPQGISPNPLNKISEVYLSQISEHHKKDVDGNTIPHEGEDVDEARKPMVKVKLKDPSKIKVKVTDIGPGGKEYVRKNEMDEGAGLYANIHAKRKRGGKMRKKGDKGAPSSQDFANAARTAKEEVEVDEAVSQSMRPSNMKKKAKLSAALDRLQALKVAKKKREMGEAFAETGMAKGSGKPSGVMKDFLDKRAKKLEKQRASQSQAARNNPAFDSTSPNSKDPAVARSRAEEVEVREGDMIEAKVDQGKDDMSKINTRNQRAFGNRRGQKGGGHLSDDMEKRRENTKKGRGVKMRGKKDKTPVDYHGRDREKRIDNLLKPKVKMEALSDWREDYVWEADEEKMEKEVKEKKVKNKIIINPKLGEAVEEIGGEVLEIVEMEKMQPADDPQLKSKENRQRQLKKQVLLRKLQAVRQTGGEDITASYEPEGEQLDEIGLANAIRVGGALGIAGGAAALIPQIKKFATKLKNINKQKMQQMNQMNEYEPEGEQLDEYGNPRVGVRLRVARAIDKTNPKPRMDSKRSAISNKLKMSAIKAETKRRQQKENPYSAGKRMKMVATSIGDRVKQKAKAMTTREDYIPEEGYDHYRDQILMRGGDHRSKETKERSFKPSGEKPKGMTAAQKAAKGRSALDIVNADIRKKYGKDAIMDLGKK